MTWPPKAPRAKTPAAPKKVTFELIPRESHTGAPVYERLDHWSHKPLFVHLQQADARIALAWATSWKRDVDGRLTLGKCKKASDLDRELAPFDFVIMLNRDYWFDLKTSNLQRDALLVHELCHASVVYDEKGDIKVDERGRSVFRIRKHDIEEFLPVIELFGLHKKDLEAFGEACARALEKTATGWISYTAVREQLILAGLTLPIEEIMFWSEEQRREVMTWALIRADQQAAPLLKIDTEANPTPARLVETLEEIARRQDRGVQ